MKQALAVSVCNTGRGFLHDDDTNLRFRFDLTERFIYSMYMYVL